MPESHLRRSAVLGISLGAILTFSSCTHTSAETSKVPPPPPEPLDSQPATDHTSPFLVKPQDPDCQLVLNANPNLDERRFLVHRLYDLGRDVPALSSPTAGADLDRLASEAVRIQTYATAANLDQEISASCVAFVAMLDEQQRCLSGRAIDGAIQAKAEQEANVGALTEGVAIGLSADSWEQALGLFALAQCKGLLARSQQQEALSQAQQARQKDADRRAQRHLGEIDTLVCRLADRLAWPAKGTGRWNSDTMSATTGAADLRERWSIEADQRPDDPFIAMKELNALLEPAVGFRGARRLAPALRSAILSAVDDCLNRYQWIPGSRNFDGDRVNLLSTCALALAYADGPSLTSHGYRDGPTTSGKLLRHVLANYRHVVGAENEVTRALGIHALAASGDLAAAEAAFQAHAESFEKDADFTVLYAEIQAAHGDLEAGMSTFEHAISLGYNAFWILPADRDLYVLRKAYPARWAEAVTPKWAWTITWGVFKDDLVLTNQSTYILTNVTVQSDIVVDGVTTSPKLPSISELAPGQSYTWTNCLSIRKERMTSARAILACDQVIP
jgi:hypothetical protein